MSGADTVPGTEVMVDPGGFHLAKSNGNETVLIPQPTEDPHDPLVCLIIVDLQSWFGLM